MGRSASLASLPGPAPMAVVGWRGNLLRFFRDPIGYMAPLPKAHGAVVPFARGGAGPVLMREASETVFAFGAENAQAVYTQMAAFHSTRIPGPPESRSFERLTAGLFSMNEDKHRQQRRLIQPAFHRQRLESYHRTMVDFTERAIEGWRAGDTVDVLGAMTALTLSVADKALFGRDPSPGALGLGEQIQEVVDLAIHPGSLVPLDLPFTPRRRLIQAAARTEEALRAVIAEKRARAAKGERQSGEGQSESGQSGERQSGESQSGGGLSGDDDVLATLIAARDEEGEALSEDELIGQMFILFFAGHDTTKSAAAWTLFLLSQHPDVLASVVEELRGELRGSAPRGDQLARLPLLDRVIKEGLRLFPPAPFTGRLTTQPVALGGVEIPAGVEVMISPYCLHRDDDVYTSPQRFAPDRWEKLAPTPFEYAPFGAGPRMCIGAGFATLELKIVLSILLQRFTFELPARAAIDRKTTVVMAPKGGLPMVLREAGARPARSEVRGNVREMVDLPA